MSEEISYTDEEVNSNVNVAFYRAVNETGEELDYVRITIPGNAFTIIEEPVNEGHKIRFKRHWDAYINVKMLTGTPIDEWDVPEPIKKEFKKQEFNYIEQIANAPDALLQNIMGFTTWRQKARAHIEANKVTPEKIINAQQAQIADLQEKLAELSEFVKPKRGRPAATAET